MKDNQRRTNMRPDCVARFVTFTIHGVHGLKGHDFGCLGVGATQQFLQVLAVIMAEDEALGAAVPYALDH
jgi:hypothetical protein